MKLQGCTRREDRTESLITSRAAEEHNKLFAYCVIKSLFKKGFGALCLHVKQVELSQTNQE